MLWGKDRGLTTPYPLLHHLIDTAAAMHVLWEVHVTPGVRRWVAEELRVSQDEAGKFVTLLAGLHDIGKAIPCFQRKLHPASPEWIGHDEATYLVLPTLLGSLDPVSPFHRQAPYLVGQLLAGHHGRFPYTDPRRVERPLKLVPHLVGDQSWHEQRAHLVSVIGELVDNPALPGRLPPVVAAVLSGVVITADWLASDTAFIREQQESAPDDPATRFRRTLAAMRTRVADAGLRAPEFAESVSVEQVWGFAPNPLQRSISEEFAPAVDEAGLLVITAPPGTGKSEASFLAAHALGRATGRTGLFLALPTTATADQLWGRLKYFVDEAAVGRVAVTLAHSMAAFNADYQATEDVTGWLRDPKTTLLAGLCVGTIDQALMAALGVRHNMLRMHGLANKTVIVDETHANTPYMRELLAGLLSWCGRMGVAVVLLSATLPTPVRAELTAAYLGGAGTDVPSLPALPYPGWVFAGRSGRVLKPSVPMPPAMPTGQSSAPRIESHRSRRQEDRRAIVEGYAHQVVRGGGHVVVLCNTVATAQRTFLDLKALTLPGVDLVLLHARFPQWQRRRITENLVERFGRQGRRGGPSIIVATQVLEQSLDVDFDLVLSDLAPIALLLQRLGRCWRHDRRRPDGSPDRPSWTTGPRLVALDPVDLRSEHPTPVEWKTVYSDFELAATHRLLAGRTLRVRGPGDINALVQEVHAADANNLDPELRRLWDQQYATHRAQTHYAGIAGIRRAEQLVDLSTLTQHDVSGGRMSPRPGTDAEDRVSTRLGMDTARVIPRYTDADGQHWLDREHTVAWPSAPPNPDVVKLLLDHSILCPGKWVGNRLSPNPTWKRSAMLRDAVVLPSPTHEDLTVDPELGLVRREEGR